MYLSGETAFRAKVADPSSTLSAFPRESCAQHHQHWEVRVSSIAKRLATKTPLSTASLWHTKSTRVKSYVSQFRDCNACKVWTLAQVLFWDMAAVKRLLQTSYPWFMETFQSYAAEVNKADASRPFIMHKFGGQPTE